MAIFMNQVLHLMEDSTFPAGSRRDIESSRSAVILLLLAQGAAETAPATGHVPTINWRRAPAGTAARPPRTARCP